MKHLEFQIERRPAPVFGMVIAVAHQRLDHGICGCDGRGDTSQANATNKGKTIKASTRLG